MKKTNVSIIFIALVLVATFGVTGRVYAGAQGWGSFDPVAYMQQMIGGTMAAIASSMGFSNLQSSTYIAPNTSGFGSHSGLSNVYTDSSGNILSIVMCNNGYFGTTQQTVCQSAGNSCGMTGSGFVTQSIGHDNHGNITMNDVSGCSAQTPPNDWCPQTGANGNNGNGGNGGGGNNGGNGGGGGDNGGGGGGGGGNGGGNSCSTGNICSDGGDVINSCTGALVTSCPYGCTAGVCNLTCTPKNVCRSDGNVHDRCSDALIETCPAGCANGQCKNSCTQPSICGADGDVHDGCSTGALVGACSFGCSNGTCYTTPSAASVTAFAALPALVQSGATTKIHWVTTHATSCTVKGTNGDSWTGVFGDQITAPITGQTIYTLTCTGADNGTISQTATINIVPTYLER